MDSTLAIKNSHTYYQNSLAIKAKYYTHAPRGIDWQEKTIARPRPPLIRKTIKKINNVPTSSHNGSPYVHAMGITNSNTSISTNPQLLTIMTLISPSLYLKTNAMNQTSHIFNDL